MAMKIEQVKEGALLGKPTRVVKPAHDRRADLPVQPEVPVGVAPAQVGLEHLAREIMRVEAIPTLLYE
jgi:hypothetical protein